MKNKRGKPLKFKSVKDLQERIDLWLDSPNIKSGKEVPTICGLAVALDCDRQTLLNYAEKEEYFGTIKKIKVFIESVVEQRLFSNNVAGVIFNLKNNFNWKDQQNIDHTTAGKELPQPILGKIKEK